MKKILVAVCIISLLTLLAGSAFAVRPPLITDEATTIGERNGELEFNAEYAHNSNEGVTEKETVIEPKLTYGLRENVDISLAAPYKFLKVTGEEDFSSDGLADMALNLKWRFYEEHGLSFALRPGITLPTGDDEELGTGRITYSIFLLGTKEVKPWAFHANLGYLRNENDIDERKDLLYASMAAEVEVAEHLELVADLGVHTNPERDSGNPPAYILGGLIYSASKAIDIDCGLKGGLTNTEPDYTIIAGIKLKF